MTTYKIVRGYFKSDMSRRTIKTGLSLEDAQKHCSDPETSSRTCTSRLGKRRTQICGPWFDNYEMEDD